MVRIYSRILQKDLHDPDNHDGVITHLESDILECEVQWALGSISKHKATGGDGIPAKLFHGDCSHEIKRCLLFGRKAMANLDSILKSRVVTLPTKLCLVKAMFFSCSHVWMWELNYRESWVPKKWCFWTVVLEKTLESSLDYKEIHPKGAQSWIFIGRTDAKAETPVLWSPMGRTDSFEKTLMLGKIEGSKKTGWQMMWWLDDHTSHHLMNMNFSKL